jgi:hypothetical protein
MYSASAVAQEATVPGPEEQQLTLPGGKLFLDAFLEVSLSKDAAFKPVSLAPDLWYGINDDLTLGLVHSTRGATGIFGNAGDGICFTGKSNGCAKIYDNIGIDARYQLLRKSSISLAADGGLFVGSFDPFMLSFKLGALARFYKGPFSVELDPSLFIGITERDAGNEEIFTAPATFMYTVMPKLGIAAQFALTVPFVDTGLTMFGASIGAQYFITDQLILDAVFSLPAMMAGELVAVDGVDARTLTLGVAYAF